MLVVVVVRQTGHRLVGLRIERHTGLGVEVERLPATGHQRQVEGVAQRPLSDQPQAAAADRTHLRVERHAQRIPVRAERVGVELVVLVVGRRGDGLDGVLRRVDVAFAAVTADHVRPAVLVPFDLLDRGLAAERAPAARVGERLGLVVPRAAAQRGVVPFAGRGVHQGAVALLLQVAARGVEIRDERVRGRGLERELIERAGACHDLLVGPHGAALGREQVVPAVDLVQVRALDELDVVAHPDRAGRLRLQLHRLDVELGQRDAVERMLVFTVIPGLLHQVLAAVVVMEQAGVEAHAVDANRTGPRAVDVLGGGQVVGAVLERAVDDLHVGVDQPELAVGVAQVRGPDTTGGRVAAHVEQLGGVQRGGQRVPVHHVLRLVQADAREPFESGVGDVVSVTDADHRGIGVEAGEHGVGDLHH